ncbi:hypothetical protein Dda3937_04381 [Dickeya dadantii 3937]|uniref:Uncharacterized protein n=1 Tax=Dickeya dadantii (strain 3937) TaxID=198628 RepID=E0SBI0_DICD3|nr:hypothetical protein Dda3937_04381 [Dickeya dadantii 3937]
MSPRLSHVLPAIYPKSSKHRVGVFLRHKVPLHEAFLHPAAYHRAALRGFILIAAPYNRKNHTSKACCWHPFYYSASTLFNLQNKKMHFR